MHSISKSRFKSKALEIMRRIEQTGETLIITDHGKPTLELRPFCAGVEEDSPARLRYSVTAYENPTEPVGEHDWPQNR